MATALTLCPLTHSYRQRAQKLSEIHRDQPGHPVRRAVYWIEYVLRHAGAPHLRAAVHQLSFCQYFLLDAAAVLVLAGAVLYMLLARVAALLAQTVPGRRPGCGRCPNGVANGACERNGRAAQDKKVK